MRKTPADVHRLLICLDESLFTVVKDIRVFFSNESGFTAPAFVSTYLFHHQARQQRLPQVTAKSKFPYLVVLALSPWHWLVGVHHCLPSLMLATVDMKSIFAVSELFPRWCWKWKVKEEEAEKPEPTGVKPTTSWFWGVGSAIVLQPFPRVALAWEI